MSKHTQTSTNKGDQKSGEEPSTLVAASADLPHFKEGMDFEDWVKTVRSNIHLYPQRLRIPLILHALPQELFSAAVDAGVSPDSDLDQCCEILAQLVIDQQEESLAREFFLRDQKSGENDEDYAGVLQTLAERAFRGCPPNKVKRWVAVQFKSGVRPPSIAAKLQALKTSDLSQLVDAATRKRQEIFLTSPLHMSHR